MSLFIALHAAMPKERGAELAIAPDSQEYAWMAYLLAREGRLTLPFGQMSLPPRYPWGFPLMLAAFLKLWPVAPCRLHNCVAVVAALLVLACYHLGCLVTSWVAGARSRLAASLAASFLGASPLLLAYSSQVMADVPSALGVSAMMLILLWLLRGEGAARPLLLAAMGLVLGWSSTIRVTNGIFAIASGALLAWQVLRRQLPAREAVAYLAGLSVPLTLFLATNQWLYHTPFGNGYEFWVPGSNNFGVRFLTVPAMREWGPGNLGRYAGTWLGWWPEDLPLSPAMTVAALVGLLAMAGRGARRLHFALCVALSAAALQGLFLFYQWQGARFVIPSLVAIPPFSALGLVCLFRSKRRAVRALAIFLVLFAGAQHAVALSSAFALAATPPPHIRAALERVDETVPPRSLVVSDLSVPLLHLYLARGDRQVLSVLPQDPVGFGECHLWQLARFPERSDALPPVIERTGSALTTRGRLGYDVMMTSVGRKDVFLVLLRADRKNGTLPFLLDTMRRDALRVRLLEDYGDVSLWRVRPPRAPRTIP